MIVLLNVAWMCATPCGTMRFFLNSFFFFVDFAGACTAASCCGSFAKSVSSLETCSLYEPFFRSLLARGDFLLGRNGALARSLARAGVRVRALATHRQVAPVAQAAVALNFDQPANVHLDLLAEIAFDAALGFNGLAQLIDFFLGQVLDLLGFVHVRLGAERPRARLPDAVDRREADPDTLLQRKIYSS